MGIIRMTGDFIRLAYENSNSGICFSQESKALNDTVAKSITINLSSHLDLVI